jgi:hypothetical protein
MAAEPGAAVNAIEHDWDFEAARVSDGYESGRQCVSNQMPALSAPGAPQFAGKRMRRSVQSTSPTIAQQRKHQ